jgi:uncharacterized protein YndB with AHSA1/START domain
MLETRNSSTATLAPDTSERELIISRVFDAPRELVFDAWSDPRQIEQWWGPNGFTTTTEKFDFRVGGEWRHTMRGPDGTEYPNESVFTEIVRPERIVRTHGGGKKGERRSVDAQMTVTFETEGNKTRLTMRMVFPTVEMFEFVLREHKAEEGGKQTLERLANYLARPVSNDYVLHISRMFSAPRELVYKAFTDPAMLAEWMGPRGFQAQDIEHDFRVGGKWRLCLHRVAEETGCDPGDKTDLWQHGKFLEIDPPERIVYTFAWENRGEIPNYETTITVTFRELEGKTVMDFRQGIFNSVAERDGHMVGWDSAFDRFAEFLLAPTPPREPTYDLVLERIFDAPRELVWKAWTDPAQLAIWWGPKGFTNPVCSADVRPGGEIYIEMSAPDGTVFPMRGKFHEVVELELIVFSSGALDAQGKPMFEVMSTVTFTGRGATSVITLTAEVTSMTAMAPRHLSGMREGWSQSLDRLAELLTKS